MKAIDRVYDYQYQPVLARKLLRDNAIETLEDQDSINQLQETYSVNNTSHKQSLSNDTEHYANEDIDNQGKVASLYMDDDFASTIATNTIDSPTMGTMKSSIHVKDTAEKGFRGTKKVTISVEDILDHSNKIELSPHNKLPKISNHIKEQITHIQMNHHQPSQQYPYKAIESSNTNTITANNDNGIFVNISNDQLNGGDDNASAVTDISLSTFGGLHHSYNNNNLLYKNNMHEKDIQSLPGIYLYVIHIYLTNELIFLTLVFYVYYIYVRKALLRYASAMKKEQYRIEQMNKSNARKYLLSNTQRLIPKFPKREHQDHMKSMFEAKVIGIGKAQEDEEKEKLLELKKRQWHALIEEKREKQAEDRKKEIESQQQEFLNSSLAEKHLV